MKGYTDFAMGFFWARSYSNEASWQYEVHGLGQSTKNCR